MTRDESEKRERAEIVDPAADDLGDELPVELRDAQPFASEVDDADDGFDEHDVEIDGTLHRHRFGLVDLIITIVLGFLFLVSARGPLGNLLQFPAYLTANGYSDIPWATLVGAVASPIVLFVAAIVAGRGRGTFERALILVVALAAASALGISLDWLTLAGVRVV